MLYGAETWATTKKQENGFEVNAMRMCGAKTRRGMDTYEGQGW